MFSGPLISHCVPPTHPSSVVIERLTVPPLLTPAFTPSFSFSVFRSHLHSHFQFFLLPCWHSDCCAFHSLSLSLTHVLLHCRFIISDNPLHALLFICCCFHGSPVATVLLFFHLITFPDHSSSLFLTMLLWFLPLPVVFLLHLISFSFLCFPEFCAQGIAFLLHFFVLLCLLLSRHVRLLSSTPSFILQPSTDLSVLSLVFSSGGVSWEGQLIYPPKKGTKTPATPACAARDNPGSGACALLSRSLVN